MIILTREETIMKRLQEQYNEALEYFPETRIVGIFLQGSQNYLLDYENSDIDSKLVVLPSFEDICFNRKPVSTTHICENEEHIDFKDIRLMLLTFRKQNINFIEILFTDYKIVNPLYEDLWNKLVEKRELIARYDELRAVQCMKGTAMEKFHALKHPYPSKLEVLDKYGYDPKQLHHIIRLHFFISKYISGDSYKSCLILPADVRKYLIEIKKGEISLEYAEEMAELLLNDICNKEEEMKNKFQNEHFQLTEVDNLLNDIQCAIMKKGLLLNIKN